MLLIVTSSPAQSVTTVIGQVIKLYPGLPHKVQNFPNILPDLQAGEVMLLCGGKGLELCQQAGIAPKNRTIGSLRNQAIPYKLGHIFLSYDPRYALDKDYSAMVDIQWDTQLAIRFHNEGTTKPVMGEYRYVDDFMEAIEWIEAKYTETSNPVPVVADLETLGFDWIDNEAFIVSLQITYNPEHSDMMYFTKDTQPQQGDDIWEQINWLFNSGMISMGGANPPCTLR